MVNRLKAMGIIVFLVLISMQAAFAANKTINVTGSVGNAAPDITAVYVGTKTTACTSTEFSVTTISLSGFTLGTDYLCIRVKVTDTGGDNTIDVNGIDGSIDSNIMIYKATGTEASATANKWDYKFDANFKTCATAADTNQIANGTGEVCAQIAPDAGLTSTTGFGTKDMNGLYRITVWMQDTNKDHAPDVNRDCNVTVNTTVGLNLSETACGFTGTADHNYALVCTTGGTELVTATHSGDINSNLSVQATTALSGVAAIATSNFAYAVTDLSNTDPASLITDWNGLGTSKDVNKSWTRGISDTAATQATYLYLHIPAASPPGAYTGGVITYTAAAVGTT